MTFLSNIVPNYQLIKVKVQIKLIKSFEDEEQSSIKMWTILDTKKLRKWAWKAFAILAMFFSSEIASYWLNFGHNSYFQWWESTLKSIDKHSWKFCDLKTLPRIDDLGIDDQSSILRSSIYRVFSDFLFHLHLFACLSVNMFLQQIRGFQILRLWVQEVSYQTKMNP